MSTRIFMQNHNIIFLHCTVKSLRYRAFVAVFTLLALASCLGSHAQQATATPPAHQPLSFELQDNLLLIGWDGVQWNHLQELLHAGRLPNLEALQKLGTLVSLEITDHTTDTKAGWTEINTGLSASASGVYSDLKFSSIPPGKTLYERLKKLTRNTVFTGFVSGKSSDLGSAAGEPWYYAHVSFSEWHGDKARKAGEVGDIFLGMLDEQKPGSRFAIFAHFSDPDSAGHADGENSDEYTAAIVKCDEWLGTVRTTLGELGLAGNTIIAITTDHGFNEGARSHSEATKTFFAVNDTTHTYHSGNQIDIAPTLMALLGAPATSFSDMTGKPLWE